MSPTTRSTSVHVVLELPVERAGRLAVSVAAAAHLDATEVWSVTAEDGSAVPHHEVVFDRGTRVHVLDAPVGRVRVDYAATIATTPDQPAAVTEEEAIRYVLPSRYCPSDRVEGYAATEFSTYEDEAHRVRRVAEWVHGRLSYEPGSTSASDDALVPLHTGKGVCRDYAHLVVTLCRALGVPARYVSVYAPGLSPMDAHAVAEVAVDGVWRLVDATRLAPRGSMVRIGTGRDAADVAVVTGLGGESGPSWFAVTATAEPDLPADDAADLVSLA